MESKVGTVKVKADKANVTANRVKVTKQKEPPIRTEVKNPLTKEQKEELNKAVNDLCETELAAKKYSGHGLILSKLFKHGLEGRVNAVAQIEQEEFDLAIAWIKQQKAIACSNKTFKRVMKGNRNGMIAAIHQNLTRLGVPDATRREYMLKKYGVSSCEDMTNDQLEDFLQYVKGNPKWKLPGEDKSIQKPREKALSMLIDELALRAKENGEHFDPMALSFPGGKAGIRERLASNNVALFGDLSEDAFNAFWSKQNLCKMRPGKPRG